MNDKLKVNLGCGKDIRSGYINIDFERRDNAKVDIVADLTKEIPLSDNSVNFIYSAHLIEHLYWNDGIELLKECFRCLEKGGFIRFLFPDYRKIFRAYVDGDDDFFYSYKEHLNNVDYPYYKSLMDDPESVLNSRISSPPPEWHTSNNPNERKRVSRRVRKYSTNIEVVDWFVHQYGEHVMLYDAEYMTKILTNIGFDNISICDYDEDIDLKDGDRKHHSICFQAFK
jgi:SAM-dependent methyltransferase